MDSLKELIVSILAQPGGRALPKSSRQPWEPWEVSILAQPGGRALLHPCPQQLPNALPSFNPRPARGPGAACR